MAKTFKTTSKSKSGYTRQYKDGTTATFTKSMHGGRAKMTGGSGSRTNKRKK